MTTTGPGEEVFQTDLIGLKEDGPPAILATFDWTNTFNGWLTAEGTGGIVLAVAGATDVASDSTSGTGGITIVDIDGQAVSEVPEPPSGLLLSSVTILFILVGRVHAKNQTARSRVAGWRDTRCRAGACAKLQ